MQATHCVCVDPALIIHGCTLTH